MVNKDKPDSITLPTAVRVLLANGTVEEMKLESYLAGVVAAEIGSQTPLEALKAQAVASRTYVATVYRHPEKSADVCITAHCQKWKRVDPVIAPEIYRALSETWGLVALHQGKLIDAFFFEHCDGHTRSSEVMLMPPMPYLRGVGCRCGFLDMKGHGVGMCKRGASVMAREGASFEQILQHYYRGIKLIRAASEAPPPPPEIMKLQPLSPAKKETSLHQLHTHHLEPAKPARRSPVTRRSSAVTAPPKPRTTQSAPETLRAAELVQDTPPPPPVPEPIPARQRRVHIDHLPGHRMIAGSLEAAGIPITVTDPHGNQTTVTSGNATHYGEGGFETIALEDGQYIISIQGQVIQVDVQGETVFIHAH